MECKRGRVDSWNRASCLHQFLVFTINPNNQRQPKAHENDIYPGKVTRCKCERGSDQNDSSLQHVTDSPEKSIDGSLSFVFGFAARRQKQSVPRCVLDGVVGAILEHLRDPYYT